MSTKPENLANSPVTVATIMCLTVKPTRSSTTDSLNLTVGGWVDESQGLTALGPRDL